MRRPYIHWRRGANVPAATLDFVGGSGEVWIGAFVVLRTFWCGVAGMGTDERRSGRANVILAAMIEHRGARVPVRVRNLSQHGVLVVGEGIPAAETQVTFRCNGASVESWVAWSRDGRAGIQFGIPLQPEALAQREAVPRVAIVRDTREVDFRRPGFRGNQMTDEERKIVEEWNRPQPKHPDEEEPPSDS